MTLSISGIETESAEGGPVLVCELLLLGETRQCRHFGAMRFEMDQPLGDGRQFWRLADKLEQNVSRKER